ncbi:MAG TPA: cell division protein FtsA [Terriglobales bacterium]|nr:cell division protein FtsA [Terriglobales bacterium]
MTKKSELLVGLDIGTSKVAAVVGELTESGPNILGLGTAPSDGLRKGVVVNIESTVQAMDQALKEAELSAGVEIHSVIASVGGAHIRGVNSHGVIPIKSPEVDQSDVDRVLDGARAIPLPSDREILHVLPQDFVLDGQNGIRNPVGMSGVRLEAHVHIITTGSRSAQNVIKCCQRLGLHVEDLVLEPLAAAEAVLSQEEKELGVALLDIGAGTTDVLVFHRGALRHTAVLSLGGNHITSDIAAGLRTPFRDAEIIKHRSGYALASSVGRDQSVEVPTVGGRNPRLISRQALARIIEARVEEILALARNQIVKCGAENELGSGVVLTGGAAMMEGLVPLAEQVFQFPVRLGSVLALDNITEGAGATVNSPAYAAAVGLVEYGAQPRDHRPHSAEAPGVLRRAGDRVRAWIETFF